MKLPDSTEWALHSAVSLALLGERGTASAAALAQYYDVPPAYLAKQLKAMVRAGILASTTGPRGGFRLAKPAQQVTLLDIVQAIDGTSAPYQCQEIRQRGTGALPEQQCRRKCILAAKMADAHEAWQASLASVTLADITAALPRSSAPRTRVLLSRIS